MVHYPRHTLVRPRFHEVSAALCVLMSHERECGAVVERPSLSYRFYHSPLSGSL